jgi:segregation and condensation protein B
VNVDGVMRTLLTRGLVEEAGEDHSTGAHLYRTTSYFLERIGVTSLDELPELAPYLPDLADLEDFEEELVGSGAVVSTSSTEDGVRSTGEAVRSTDEPPRWTDGDDASA